MTHTGMILVFTPLLAAYLVFALVRRGYRLARPRVREEQSVSSDQAWWRDLAARSCGWSQREHWPAALRRFSSCRVGGAALCVARVVAGQYLQLPAAFRLPDQFLDTFWGYGYSDDPTGPNDGMSFQLGVIGVGLALTAVAVGLRRRSPQRSTTAFFLAALLAILFAMTPFARPLWDAVGLLAVLQFPWRMLSIASFCLAMLSGAAIASLIPADGLADSEATAHGSAHPRPRPLLSLRCRRSGKLSVHAAAIHRHHAG